MYFKINILYAFAIWICIGLVWAGLKYGEPLVVLNAILGIAIIKLLPETEE